jgi:hypothetical protein
MNNDLSICCLVVSFACIAWALTLKLARVIRKTERPRRTIPYKLAPSPHAQVAKRRK